MALKVLRDIAKYINKSAFYAMMKLRMKQAMDNLVPLD